MPATTRQFKNGDSLAVHIPAEMAFAPDDAELLLERVGDELRIRPKRQKLEGLGELFAALGNTSEPWVREDSGTGTERQWDLS